MWPSLIRISASFTGSLPEPSISVAPSSAMTPSPAGVQAADIRTTAAVKRIGGRAVGSRPLTRFTSGRSTCGRGGSASARPASGGSRSEEHTSELQSRLHLVCRLLLEKKKKNKEKQHITVDKTRFED